MKISLANITFKLTDDKCTSEYRGQLVDFVILVFILARFRIQDGFRSHAFLHLIDFYSCMQSSSKQKNYIFFYRLFPEIWKH